MIRALLSLLLLTGAAHADVTGFRGEYTAGVRATLDGERREIAVWGQPSRSNDGPITEDDAWHIGSLTKAMTATLAGRLVATGHIAWDTRVGDVLEGAAFADATLADLLTHRSGMAANLPTWRAVFRPGRAAYVAHMLGTDPEGPRGTFLYSNAGYVVAAAMMERATGQSWEVLLRRAVWEPLGMEGMGFGPPGYILGRGGRADPHARGSDNLPAMAPAGAVHAPARAMLAFLRAHRDRDPTFLPVEVWDRLHSPIGDYAMGWSVSEAGLSHFGSNTLWFAGVAITAQSVLFVAVNDASEASQIMVRSAVAAALRATPE